jgi:hypothetical protein
MNVLIKESSFIPRFFLILFISIFALIYSRVIETPIDPHALEYKVYPNLNKSFIEILFSPWHSETAHWRMPVTNWFYSWWGVNEFTYKLFPILINLFTLILIYQWVKTQIGRTEAVIAAFLFGISYYNIWITVWVHFAEFYMFASLLTVIFLIKGWEKDGWRSWWIFAFWNFLNVTNTILPFLFQPAICFILVYLGWTRAREKPNSRKSLKLKSIQFLTTYSTSLIAALIFYQIKGVNFLQNAFDLLTKGEFVDKALLPIATKTYAFNEGTPLTNLTNLIKNTFVTLNFENHNWVMGHSFAHWLYFTLFLIGLIRLFKTRKTLFGIFISMFIPPVLILGLLIGMIHGRFLAFILPFYLICVATGFVWLVSTIGRININIPKQEAIVYISTFFLFSWVLGFPNPVWSKKFLDKSFRSEGYPSIRNYLKKNIQPNDVILNVTNFVDLNSQFGFAPTLASLPEYFKQFHKKHRLELLGKRKGKTGIWLILNKPLSNSNYDPFYFPRGYQPELVLQKTRAFLYHDNLHLSDPLDIKNDNVFRTPFWNFLKGYTLQETKNYFQASNYYNKFIKYGINSERAHFNLGLMHIPFSYENALKEFLKVIEILETPTETPKGVKVHTMLVNEHDKAGMAQKVSEFKQPLLRYYFLNQDNYKLMYWFKEDMINKGGHLYSMFYFVPALLIYNHFIDKMDEPHISQVVGLIEKGLKIDRTSKTALQLISLLEQIKTSKKVINPPKTRFPYATLINSFDPFPELEKYSMTMEEK